MPIIDPPHIDKVLQRFRERRFTTADFVVEFRQQFPDDWTTLVERYRSGYSPNNYFGLILRQRNNRGELTFIMWDTNTPTGWGSPVIAVWEA